MVKFNLTGEFNNEEALFYEVKDLTPLDYVMNCDIVYSKARNNKKAYYNYPNTFDIESTTVDCEEPFAFMYIFMFWYNGKAICGRRWEEFIEFIYNVVKYNDIDTKVVFYVHYLSYEFQFIKDFLNWQEVFAVDAHKVLRATYENIEFRCSFYLSNMSLEKFCKSGQNVKHLKQAGHFDYKVLRTPDTILTDEELTYCYCDVVGLHERLLESLEDDTMITIPYTSTGYVRRNCRLAMRKNKANRELFLKTRLNKETYTLLKEAMRGGNTHGNALHVEQIEHDVKCFDIASSYPAVMMMKYYPVTCFTKVKPTMKSFEKYLKEYCCLFRVHFIGLKIKKEVPVPYISEHKCLKKMNPLIFNGRVVEAEVVSMTVTEIDFGIICSEYTYEKFAISDFYIAKRGELPKELKDEIMTYFYNKTTLKKVDPYLYAKSKNLLNSIFGMACTDPVRETMLYSETVGWVKETEDIEEALDKYYSSYNSFLPYQWGIWVTAHARLQLEKSLRLTKSHTVYVDTDSNKCVDVPDNILDGLNEEIKKEAEEHKAYVDFNGERYYLGVFEQEDTCKDFITMGAKKYAYTEEDDTFHITISGVSKKLGAQEMIEKAKEENTLPIEQFKRGFTFYNCGRTVHRYNEERPHYITVNGCKILNSSNIAITDSTYKLNTTNDFESFIENNLDIMI